MGKNTNRMKGFTQGYACAVATLMQNYGESTYVEELIGAGGLTLKVCKENDVDDYDMKILRPILKKMEDK
jgi:hypothetical protein